jgi:hypothetical protein
VAAGREDYELLMEDNKSLLAERNTLRDADLESELAEARTSAAKDIDALESKVSSAEAHSVNVAAAGERRLAYFKDIVHDLADMCMLYERNVQSIEGLCSSMPRDEP